MVSSELRFEITLKFLTHTHAHTHTHTHVYQYIYIYIYIVSHVGMIFFRMYWYCCLRIIKNILRNIWFGFLSYTVYLDSYLRQTSLFIDTRISKSVTILLHTHTHTHTYIHIYIYIYIYIYKHKYAHVIKIILMSTYMCVYVWVYIYIYIYELRFGGRVKKELEVSVHMFVFACKLESI